MSLDFSNQTALITGGSSGIGLATACLLSAYGAHIWLLARQTQQLDAALAEVRSARQHNNQRIEIISADVSDPQKLTTALKHAEGQMGTPDLLINSAGIVEPGYFQEISVDDFYAMMQVNYFGMYHVIHALLPGMLARGSGHIVNISSMAAVIGIVGYTGYSGSKFAVRGFSDALRAELKPQGIDVSLVLPPDTDTPQLVYDNLHRPVETKAIGKLNSILSAETVAREILQGVAKNKYLIIPGWETKISYWAITLGGPLVYPVIDWLTNRARNQQNGNEPQDK